MLTTSERIECGACGFKLGRCGMAAAYLPCSCGRQCSGPPPYFAVQLARVDPIEHSALLKAPRAVGADFAARQAEAETAGQRSAEERRSADRRKREGKKTKRQQRQDQRGNFTNFRNKSLVKAKGDTREETEEEGHA